MLICALIKYGYSNFRLEILEYCSSADCLARENYYLNILKSEYNIVQQSSTMPSRLGSVHTKVTIAKISKAQPNRVTISITDLSTNTVKTYDSLSQAAKDININRSYIARLCLKGQVTPIKGRYLVTKLETTHIKTVKVVES